MSYQTLDLFLDAGATILITYLSIKKYNYNFKFNFGTLCYYSMPDLTLKFKYFLQVKKNYLLKALITGWQALKKEKEILILILPFALTNLFYGISSVGLPYFATQFLNKSAISYGSLELAFFNRWSTW